MPKLPSTSPKALIRFLKKQGFLIDHQTGSHLVLYRFTDKKRAVIPIHSKDLPKGTLLAILKEAGFTREDFMSFSI